MPTQTITDDDVAVAVRPGVEKVTPPQYKVILLNDDYTSMEFVVDILQNVFHKTLEQAIHLMQEIHEQGSGVCGVYVKSIAETRQAKVLKAAQAEQFPLQCIIEPDKPQPSGGSRPKF